MSERWCPVKVKELGTVVTGKTPPTKNKHNFGKGYPFIKPPDLSENTRTIKETETEITKVGLSTLPDKLIPPKSTCVVCIGSIGKKIGLTSLPSITNQQINSIVVNQSSYDPFLVYYLLRAALPQVKQLDAGSASGRENVNKSTFENIEVCVPSIEIQRKIASILSPYDDLIENNIRRIKILEEMAQTIYNEWFVKFRFPGHENVKMVESELGMIPEGWEVKKLNEVIELAYGKALKKENRVEGQIPVYGSSGVVGYHNELLVKGPGIIVGRKGNVGSVYWSDVDFYPIDTVFYVNSELSLYYLYYNLQTQNFINNDAAVPGLSRNQAYLLPFLVPSKEVLIRFEEVESSFFEQKNNLIEVNNNLRTTRDLLLPRLISGEIDVSELDIDVGGITA